MNKKIINMNAVDEINLTTKRYTLKASESIKEQTKTYESKSTKYTHQTNDATIKSPKTRITGKLNVGGNTTLESNLHVGGNQTTAGSSDNHHSH